MYKDLSFGMKGKVLKIAQDVSLALSFSSHTLIVSNDTGHFASLKSIQ